MTHAVLLFGVRVTYNPVESVPQRRQNRQPEMTFVELTTISDPGRTPPSTVVVPETVGESARMEGRTASSNPLREQASEMNASNPSGPDRHPLVWSGFRDKRIRLGSQANNGMENGPVKTESLLSHAELRSLLEVRIASDQERSLAERQITILGQRVTVFGDSSAYHSGFHWNFSGRRATLPVDGRDWEDLQMRRQRDAFTRDSILRERIRGKEH